jgi:hypothetical protein
MRLLGIAQSRGKKTARGGKEAAKQRINALLVYRRISDVIHFKVSQRLVISTPWNGACSVDIS